MYRQGKAQVLVHKLAGNLEQVLEMSLDRSLAQGSVAALAESTNMPSNSLDTPNN
jgi:hypothetical protein